jgi:hypothetical protein
MTRKDTLVTFDTIPNDPSHEHGTNTLCVLSPQTQFTLYDLSDSKHIKYVIILAALSSKDSLINRRASAKSSSMILK